MTELKKDWTLRPEAFRRLLHWLDDGNDSGGERYLEVRRRLTAYFDRKNCPSSDELADETLNRVARKLEEKGAITEVSGLHYCYIMAKFVFLENVRRTKPVQIGVEGLRSNDSATSGYSKALDSGVDESEEEKMFNCLDTCLDKLSREDRELILEYYRGEGRVKIERRLQLGARLRLTPNAFR